MILEITICLGSSCFARGNKKTVKVIQDFIKENKLEDKVIFKGNHCFGDCSKGPIVKINDKIYEHVDSEKALEILKMSIQ
jgi:NADH:ubiquinone oxidoreductase subunit E